MTLVELMQKYHNLRKDEATTSEYSSCDGEKFYKYECCDEHRALKNRYEELNDQAKKFTEEHVPEVTAYVFSLVWYQAVSEKTKEHVPSELLPDWYFV